MFPGYLEHSGAGVTWIVTKVTIYRSLGVLFLLISLHFFHFKITFLYGHAG